LNVKTENVQEKFEDTKGVIISR